MFFFVTLWFQIFWLRKKSISDFLLLFVIVWTWLFCVHVIILCNYFWFLNRHDIYISIIYKSEYIYIYYVIQEWTTYNISWTDTNMFSFRTDTNRNRRGINGKLPPPQIARVLQLYFLLYSWLQLLRTLDFSSFSNSFLGSHYLSFWVCCDVIAGAAAVTQ